MYNIGINHSAEEFETAYIDTLEKSKYKVFQVDDNNMDHIVNCLDGVILKEDSEQNIGVLCGLILKIKEKSNPLIWVLTDQPSSLQKVLYLQLGVDGTFSSENAPEEVNLIIRNSLKRYQQSQDEQVMTKAQMAGDNHLGLELNPYNLSVKLKSSKDEIPLTKLEFQLMKLFYDNPSRGISYQEIYEFVWKRPYANNKYRVSNLVFHLRTKLLNGGIDSITIRTVHSKGYMLAA